MIKRIHDEERETMLVRLIKFVAIVVVLGAIGIAGYALVGDLTPPVSDNSLTVTLDGN